ncbi:MAG: transglutaminase-like domain-containing protein [Burkholderiales bacterium]
MSTPFGMVGAALLFWGWQTGWLLLALPLALLIEARIVWKPAWILDREGINRFADLSSLALIAVGAWFLVSLEAPRAARTVIGTAQWLPLTLAPLALTQAYLTRTPLDLSVLFITLRARPDTGLKVDFGFIYVIACVLAAATANVRDEMFYAGAAMLAAWSLWNLRSRRYHRIVPFAMLIVASIMGYAGHVALNQFQSALTEWVGEMISRSVNTNPFRTHTDIGHIGELKQSERVLLRVRLPEGQRTPLLLHRASYNVFSSPSWVARPPIFDPLTGDAANGWSLRDATRHDVDADADAGVAGKPSEAVSDGANRSTVKPLRREQAIEMLEYARGGKTIASLPTGTVHLDGLQPSELRRSRMGATNIETAGGFIRYRAHRGSGALIESPPTDTDYHVPAREQETLKALADELSLHGLDPIEAKRKIERFFLDNFRYTTWIEASSPFAPTPLSAFLTRTRAGHCEYFASATTLLLREAGIAARYATGFSVQEKSGGEDYLVRERHAHAWTRAWIGGQWVDIDTTPPQWFAIESGKGSAWETLSDAWSWLKFTWGRYQTSEDDSIPRPVLIGLLVLLFAGLAWSILRRPAKRTAGETRGPQVAAVVSGADSEFYRIEALLAANSLGRNRSEPVSEWLARIARSSAAARDAVQGDAAQRGELRVEELRVIAVLHYRLRFDPIPMQAAARDELRFRVERWLRETQTTLKV